MAIEIVDLPMKNVGSFHSYVIVYQRVIDIPMQLHLQPICFFCRKEILVGCRKTALLQC